MSTQSLVTLRIVLYSIWALASAWTTSMTDVTWDSMGWEQQSCLLVGVISTWTATLMAFFDKSIWKLDSEKNGEK